MRKLTWLVFLVMGMISSCGGTNWQVRYYPMGDKAYSPRPGTHPISVYNETPSRSYVEIGKITIKTTWVGNAAFGGSADEAEGIEEMKTRARQLGGDALIRVDLHTAPPGTVGHGHVGGQAIVIRWTDLE